MDDCISALGTGLASWYLGRPVTPRTGNRYGHVRWGKQWAHRIVWEAHFGPLADGAVVRHTCDDPTCVRPSHLRSGSVADNQRDMAERGRGRNQNSDTTHCKRGHDLADAYVHTGADGRTRRHCRTCRNEWKRQRRQE